MGYWTAQEAISQLNTLEKRFSQVNADQLADIFILFLHRNTEDARTTISDDDLELIEHVLSLSLPENEVIPHINLLLGLTRGKFYLGGLGNKDFPYVSRYSVMNQPFFLDDAFNYYQIIFNSFPDLDSERTRIVGEIITDHQMRRNLGQRNSRFNDLDIVIRFLLDNETVLRNLRQLPIDQFRQLLWEYVERLWQNEIITSLEQLAESEGIELGFTIDGSEYAVFEANMSKLNMTPEPIGGEVNFPEEIIAVNGPWSYFLNQEGEQRDLGTILPAYTRDESNQVVRLSHSEFQKEMLGYTFFAVTNSGEILIGTWQDLGKDDSEFGPLYLLTVPASDCLA